MEFSIARQFLCDGVHSTPNQHWADLGAGSGLFTKALASCLNPPSTIIAIDKDQRALQNIPGAISGVEVKKQVMDFVNFGETLQDLDGVLMANALHYVSDAQRFLKMLRNTLVADGRIIIVEYELNSRNPWVPFPITFDRLSKVSSAAGFRSCEKLFESPSTLNQAMIYSALLKNS